jgi:hypothetical protein
MATHIGYAIETMTMPGVRKIKVDNAAANNIILSNN